MENILFSDSVNSYFSEFNKDQIELLYRNLINFYLIYRNRLNLPSNLTFGVEIEYEKLNKGIVTNYVNKELIKWVSKKDGSLDFGGEITSPIMNDNLSYWKELKRICTFLTKNNAVTNLHAGGHIHIGANILDDNIDAWKTFLKIYICYEHILFRFGYGDKLNSRKTLKVYAYPIASYLYNNIQYINNANTLEDLHYILEKKDYYDAISFKHIRFNNNFNYRYHTIEFRFPNATTNEVIWQNNINVFSKMIIASLSNKINDEFLDYKLEHINELKKNDYRFDLIYLEDALEFVDLIFDNNLDKMYFLRQYFKNFEIDLADKHGIPIKKITK